MIQNSILRWWALVGISFLAFTAFLDYSIVSTALPFIQQDLNADVIQLQWVSNIFSIVLSSFVIAIGKIGDRWGRKRTFYFGTVAFGLAAIGAALSPNIHSLIFCRAIQGLGASCLFIIASSLLTDIFSKRDYPKAAGIYGGITGLGLVIGPFLGGILTGLLSWRWVFWINLPFIAIGLLSSVIALREVQTAQHKTPIDWLGFFLLISGLSTLVYGITASNWLIIAIGTIALVTLLFLDAKKKNPLLDLSIFKNRIVFLSLFSCGMAGIVCTVFMFFDPLYLENVRGLSPYAIGFMVAVIPLAQVLICFSFDKLLERFGLANLFLFSISTAVIAVFLHRFIGTTTSFALLLIPYFLLGFPWGLSNTGMITAVNDTVKPHKVGEAIGTLVTAWNVVGAIFLSISSLVFHKTGPDFMPAFHNMVEVNFGFMVLVLLAAIGIRWKIKKYT